MDREVFIGGLWHRAYATFPFAKMEIDETGVVVMPSLPWLEWAVSTYAFPWSSVLRVEITNALFGARNLRFYLREAVLKSGGYGWPETASDLVFGPRRSDIQRALRCIPNDLIGGT